MERQKGVNMACNHPLIRIEFNRIQKSAKTGKYSYQQKILGEFDQRKPLEYYTGKFQEMAKQDPEASIRDIQLIPCGRCIGCRLDKSKEWATRCTLEAKEYKYNWFITLTYPPEVLPEDGNLQPELMQKFMKTIRNRYKREQNHEGIRFLLCGEYGSETFLPHYHLILFNMPIPDLIEHGATIHHKAYYTSEYIKNIWLDVLECSHETEVIMDIQEYSWGAAAYVARYCTKIITGPEEQYIYENGNITKEFIRMSRNPGIGINYLKQHLKEIYTTDHIVMKNTSGAVADTKIPKAFDRKIKEIDPDFLEARKKERKEKADNDNKVKMAQTSLDMRHQMIINEELLKSKISSLKREMSAHA